MQESGEGFLPPEAQQEAQFLEEKTRFDKSQEVGEAMKDASKNPNLLQEIRDVERLSEQGASGKQEGHYEEKFLDVAGYEERRSIHDYFRGGPTSENFSEPYVYFVSKEDPNKVLADENGQRVNLNAALYDARLQSQRHAAPQEGKPLTAMPMINRRGEISGVITLCEV